MARNKPKYDPAQLILGLGHAQGNWEVLGAVDPYRLVAPSMLFRKVLRPCSAHDYDYYYKKIVIVRPWNNARPGTKLGAPSYRIENNEIKQCYPEGACVERKNEEGLVYYEVATLFET